MTIDPKLSSSRMISAASLATSVPAIPIAKPTSAFFRAAASLVPSPVTATTLSSYFKPRQRMYLSIGVDLASTFKSFTTSLKAWISLMTSFSSPFYLLILKPPTVFLKSAPVMHLNLPPNLSVSGSPVVGIMPHSLATAMAVS